MNFSPAQILRVSQGDYIHPGRPGVPKGHRFDVIAGPLFGHVWNVDIPWFQLSKLEADEIMGCLGLTGD